MGWCVQGKERAGEKIYKGHHSYDLMLNLQLGIRFSVGRVSADDNPKELAPEHFCFVVPHLPPPAQHALGQLAILWTHGVCDREHMLLGSRSL